MRFAFFGDVVGRAGRKAVTDHLPRLRADLDLHAVVINAENAAGGFGITRATAEELFDAGGDVLTLGNHSFDNPQGISVIENETRILRPCNYPPNLVPGRGADAGMCGDYNSVIGMDKEEPLNRFTTRMRSTRFTPASGPGTLCGVFVETDNRTGRALRAEPIRIGGVLSQTCPTLEGFS